MKLILSQLFNLTYEPIMNPLFRLAPTIFHMQIFFLRNKLILVCNTHIYFFRNKL